MGCGMKKKMFALLFAVVMLVPLSACGSDDGKYPVKQVRVEHLADILLADGQLIPGGDYYWGMEQEEFLSVVYGAETLRPEHEAFDQYRSIYLADSQRTDVKPPLEYVFQDTGFASDVCYTFFDDGGLQTVNYTRIYNSDEYEDMLKTAEALLNTLCENESLRFAEGQQTPDFGALAVEGQRFYCEWVQTAGGSPILDLSVTPLGDSYAVSFGIRTEWFIQFTMKR